MYFYKFKEILYIIYDLLPKSLKSFALPKLEPIYLFMKRVLLIISQIKLSVFLLDGKDKCSGNNITTLFIGGKRVMPYLSDLVYSKEPENKFIGRVFIWKIMSKIQSIIPKPDVIFIGIDKFFSYFLFKNGFIVIPGWLLFTLDLSKPLQKSWNLSKNKSLKEDIKKVKKYKYFYKMTCNPIEFEYFYHHMYLPYIPERFGKSTIHTNFYPMKFTFEKGRLLLVKQENKNISGMIIWTHNKDVYAAYLGVRDGRIEFLKRGALSAAYYFTIMWAKENRFKQIDLAHCRPFFNDGLFYYKKKWGAEIKRSTRLQSILGMKIINYHQGVLNFLEKNPFIFIDKNKLKGLIFIDQEKPLTLKEVKSLFNKYYISGINNVIIISPQRFTEKVKKFANSMSTQKLNLIRIDPDLFFKKFPHIMKLENYYDSLNEKTKYDVK